MIGDAFLFAGAIMMAFARNISELIIGRLLVGIGVGIASMTVPVFLAEQSPKQIRGSLVTTNNTLVTIG